MSPFLLWVLALLPILPSPQGQGGRRSLALRARCWDHTHMLTSGSLESTEGKDSPPAQGSSLWMLGSPLLGSAFASFLLAFTGPLTYCALMFLSASWARMSMSPTEKVHQASKRCPSPGDFCSAISHLGGKLLQIFTAPLALCRLLLFLTRNIPYHF